AIISSETSAPATRQARQTQVNHVGSLKARAVCVAGAAMTSAAGVWYGFSTRSPDGRRSALASAVGTAVTAQMVPMPWLVHDAVRVATRVAHDEAEIACVPGEPGESGGVLEGLLGGRF